MSGPWHFTSSNPPFGQSNSSSRTISQDIVNKSKFLPQKIAAVAWRTSSISLFSFEHRTFAMRVSWSKEVEWERGFFRC